MLVIARGARCETQIMINAKNRTSSTQTKKQERIEIRENSKWDIHNADRAQYLGRWRCGAARCNARHDGLLCGRDLSTGRAAEGGSLRCGERGRARVVRVERTRAFFTAIARVGALGMAGTPDIAEALRDGGDSKGRGQHARRRD
jgi:hypothetical protein